MSTLVDELEQAAKDADDCATLSEFDRTTMESRAARLRQRAAWVRELVAMDLEDGAAEVRDMLTGPIPAAEAAPTERPTR